MHRSLGGRSPGGWQIAEYRSAHCRIKFHRMLPAKPPAAAVEASLMLAAERCDDLTGAVYARLFARYPAMETEFWRDRNGAIRGEMLARVFEAIIDFCGPAAWAPAYLGTEIVTHDAYGIPRDIFAGFFAIIGETVAATLGRDWTPEMAAGWAWLDGVARAAMVPEPAVSQGA